MATITRRATGYQAEIRRRGYPKLSKSFETKREAERWARQIESEIDAGCFVDRSEAENTTLGELLRRYLAEVTPLKKSRPVEKLRIRRLLSDKTLCSYKLTALTGKVISAFRDRRLTEVSGSSVNRELAIISHAINTAIKEWDCQIRNPVATIRKPKENPARVRRLEGDEEIRLLRELEIAERDAEGRYKSGGVKNPWLRPVVLFALETGMRQGEILSLSWSQRAGPVCLDRIFAEISVALRV